MPKRISMFVVAMALFASPASEAQWSLAAVGLAGIVTGDLIDRFEEAGERLLFEGENTGNALLVSAGNQLQVATA